MGARTINKTHYSWMLPAVLVNNCLDFEFDVFVYRK